MLQVAIHNKNGKGLLQPVVVHIKKVDLKSQSTIKMEKGYYNESNRLLKVIVDGRNPQ